MNPLGSGTTTIYEFFTKLLTLIAQIAFPIIVLYIVFIGFKFVTSSGNPKQLEAARGELLYALIGAILVLGAYGLAQAIEATVNQLKL